MSGKYSYGVETLLKQIRNKRTPDQIPPCPVCSAPPYVLGGDAVRCSDGRCSMSAAVVPVAAWDELCSKVYKRKDTEILVPRSSDPADTLRVVTQEGEMSARDYTDQVGIDPFFDVGFRVNLPKREGWYLYQSQAATLVSSKAASKGIEQKPEPAEKPRQDEWQVRVRRMWVENKKLDENQKKEREEKDGATNWRERYDG